jgi:hypothetical protein
MLALVAVLFALLLPVLMLLPLATPPATGGVRVPDVLALSRPEATPPPPREAAVTMLQASRWACPPPLGTEDGGVGEISAAPCGVR